MMVRPGEAIKWQRCHLIQAGADRHRCWTIHWKRRQRCMVTGGDRQNQSETLHIDRACGQVVNVDQLRNIAGLGRYWRGRV